MEWSTNWSRKMYPNLLITALIWQFQCYHFHQPNQLHVEVAFSKNLNHTRRKIPDKLFVWYPCTEICKCKDLVVSCQVLSHNFIFTLLPASFIHLNVLFYITFIKVFIVYICYCWLCHSYHILVLLWCYHIPVLWEHIKLNHYWFY